MKNILIKIVAGIVLMPMVIQSQTNTMYFCCSHEPGGGCTPIAYPNETACEAACTETQYCDVRSVPATYATPMASVFAPPMAPYGYPAYGPGVPNIEALGTAINTAAQAGVLPARAPVTTTVGGMPVQQATAPVTTGATQQVTTVTTTTTARPVPTTTGAAVDTVGTGTAATSVRGNQVT
jgi:hypothetical protein